MTKLHINKENDTVVVSLDNPQGELKKGVNLINSLTDKLKNRNLPKANRDKLVEARYKALKGLVQLTAGAIQCGKMQSDEYGFLRANVSKKIKDSGTINRLLVTILDEISTGDRSKLFSDIEIAKLLETPYRLEREDNLEPTTPEEMMEKARQKVSGEAPETPKVQDDPIDFGEDGIASVTEEQVPEVDDVNVVEIKSNHPKDEKIIVDKKESVLYLKEEGDENFTVKKLDHQDEEESGWAKVGKSLVTGFFGYLWQKLVEWGTALMQLGLAIINLICASVLIPATMTFDAIVVTKDLAKKGWKALFGDKPKGNEKKDEGSS